MATEEENVPERELTDIRPSKVSLVDEGANAQFFFIAKSKEGTSEASSGENLKTAVAGFTQGVLERLEATREWLMQVETDEDSDIPSPIISMLVRTRDELDDMGESIKAGGNRLADAKVSGAKRDKMVSMLDVIGEKLAASVSTLLSEEGDDIPEEFMDELGAVVDGFNAVVGKSVEKESTEEIEDEVWSTAYINDLPDSAFLYIEPGGEKDEEDKTVPRTNRKFPYKDDKGNIDLPHLRNAIARIPQSNLSQSLKDELQAKARRILEEVSKSVEDGPQEDNEMTIKFAEVAKSAEKIELDQVETKKAVSSASAKLEEISSIFGIDTEEMKSADNYEVRWKLGEAIDILVRAAKLEAMLESGSVENQAPEEEEEEGNQEEEEEMSTEEKSAAEKKAAETETSAPKEAPVEKKADNNELVSLMKTAISEAVAPINEKLESIEKDLGTTTEKVEKMERARPVAKGSSPDKTETPSAPESGEGDSLFAPFMPPHLRGEVKRS